MNYKKLYHMLFNAITDALRAMEKQDFGRAREGLMQAQRDCETEYVETGAGTAGGRKTVTVDIFPRNGYNKNSVNTA